jgi:sec-independent protein translocase protein TatA
MFRNPTTDLLVVLVIVLLIFGPKRLPGLGKQLGQGIREFKDSITGNDQESEEHAQITQGNGASAPATTVNAEQRPAEPAPTEPRS